jgi:integrase
VEKDLLAQLGLRSIKDIVRADVLAAVRLIEARNAIETARRVRGYAEDIFRFAAAEGLIGTNPALDLEHALTKPPPQKHRAALKERELPAFIEKLKAYQGEPLTRAALTLIMLTFVRSTELRFADWSEFEGLDTKKPLWRIPALRMKMRTEHVVPLSARAVAEIKSIQKLGIKSRFLFPAATRSGVMSENTMIFALYRLGYHSRATVHGFRGTASTILNENNFNRDWIERQLAHVERDGVRAAYNSAEWLEERRTMMEWWACYLEAKGLAH